MYRPVAEIQLPRLASTSGFNTGDTLNIRLRFVRDDGSLTDVYVSDPGLTLEFELLCNGNSTKTLTATLTPPAQDTDPNYYGPTQRLTFTYEVTENDVASEVRVTKVSNDPGVSRYSKIVDAGKQQNIRLFKATTLPIKINGGCDSSSGSARSSASSGTSSVASSRTLSSSRSSLRSSSSRRSSSSGPRSSSSDSSGSKGSSSSSLCCGCKLPENWAYGADDGAEIPRCLSIVPEAGAYDLICVPWPDPLTREMCEQELGIFGIYYPSATDCTIDGGACFPELSKTVCDKVNGHYNDCKSSSSSSSARRSSSSSSSGARRSSSSSSTPRPRSSSSSSAGVRRSSSSSSGGRRSSSSSSPTARRSSSSSSKPATRSSSSSSVAVKKSSSSSSAEIKKSSASSSAVGRRSSSSSKVAARSSASSGTSSRRAVVSSSSAVRAAFSSSSPTIARRSSSSSSRAAARFSSSSSSRRAVSSASARTGPLQPPTSVVIVNEEECTDSAKVRIFIQPPTTGIVPTRYVYQRGQYTIVGTSLVISWSGSASTTVTAPEGFVVSGVPAYTTILYRVASVSANGAQSAWKISNQLKTSQLKPDTPLNLSATVAGCGSGQKKVDIKWTKPTAGFKNSLAQFKVAILKQDPDTGTFLNHGLFFVDVKSQTTLNYSTTVYLNAGRYSIRVYGINTAGCDSAAAVIEKQIIDSACPSSASSAKPGPALASSSSSSKPAGPPPAAPDSITAVPGAQCLSAADGGGILVTFYPSPNNGGPPITHYELQWASNDAPTIWKNEPNIPAANVPWFGYSYNVAKQAGLTYKFRVRAVSSTGTSPWTTTANWVGMPKQPPTAPKITRVTRPRADAVTLEWTGSTPPAGRIIQSYSIVRVIQRGGREERMAWSATAAARSLTAYGAVDGSCDMHEFYVQACASNGCCAVSESEYIPGNCTTTPTRYTCNANTGRCSQSPVGEYPDRATCESNCSPPPPPPTRYTCNANTGACSPSPTGEYPDRATCESDCATTPPPPAAFQFLYCNGITPVCGKSLDGTGYGSNAECVDKNRPACSGAGGGNWAPICVSGKYEWCDQIVGAGLSYEECLSFIGQPCRN